MKSMAERNSALFLLVGLCLLCVGGGFQSAEALRLWLAEGAIRSPSAKVWSETLKAAAMLLFAFAIFCNVARVLYRLNNLRRPLSQSQEQV